MNLTGQYLATDNSVGYVIIKNITMKF